MGKKIFLWACTVLLCCMLPALPPVAFAAYPLHSESARLREVRAPGMIAPGTQALAARALSPEAGETDTVGSATEPGRPAPVASEAVEMPALALIPDIPVVTATLVCTTDTSLYEPPSPDPAGVAYLPDSGQLLICDSEVNEMPPYFTGQNLFEVTLAGELLSTYTTVPFSNEPTGVAYDPVSKTLFYSDDDWNRVFVVSPGDDGLPLTADDSVAWFSCSDFGGQDPEGIAYDNERGHLLVADSTGEAVYDIAPGENGEFDGVSPVADDEATHFDTAILGIGYLEGIEFDPSSGHVYMLSSDSHFIAETTLSGAAVRYIDFASADALNPAGLALAPASDGSQQTNLYIVDRGVDNGEDDDENDGRMYEMSFPPLVQPHYEYTVYLPLVVR